MALKRYVLAAAAGLMVFAVGCGSGGAAGVPSIEETAANSPLSSEDASRIAAPERVIVYQPGLVDTTVSIHEVPAWPGPPLAEFMDHHEPEGLQGTLTGPTAREVYAAAVKHPNAILAEGAAPNDTGSGALWGLDGVVVWLVVDPQW